jgi:hypothetical protein
VHGHCSPVDWLLCGAVDSSGSRDARRNLELYFARVTELGRCPIGQVAWLDPPDVDSASLTRCSTQSCEALCSTQSLSLREPAWALGTRSDS